MHNLETVHGTQSVNYFNEHSPHLRLFKEDFEPFSFSDLLQKIALVGMFHNNAAIFISKFKLTTERCHPGPRKPRDRLLHLDA